MKRVCVPLGRLPTVVWRARARGRCKKRNPPPCSPPLQGPPSVKSDPIQRHKLIKASQPLPLGMETGRESSAFSLQPRWKHFVLRHQTAGTCPLGGLFAAPLANSQQLAQRASGIHPNDRPNAPPWLSGWQKGLTLHCPGWNFLGRKYVTFFVTLGGKCGRARPERRARTKV